MKVNHIELKNEEILRYLAYKSEEVDKDFIELVESCKKETLKHIKERYAISYNKLTNSKKGILVEGTNYVLEGKGIKNHLKDCDECVFLGATLGNDIERLIRIYEKTDLTKALIIDACATTAIESFCDNIEELIKNEMKILGKNIKFRFSPGYGDLSLDFQKSFLNIINGEKAIGLTCSEHNILLPRKSVTAIIGITDKKLNNKKRSCKECNKFNSCTFRRKGSEKSCEG
ncbi:methionine synthase [Clostridium tarantellae]|uniref:Methionine synthase n=1 Tax=Clostridium tarantellae TaxID=39493 RepID=A0A6I1MLL0_9CLOT|nr:methionine synthase [Clostridium tarantellae]MPQ43122.1 methionine synthase [Clostridium tarantellae]